MFGVTKGKLLGHILTREGTKINPEKVKAIQILTLSTRKTRVHSFFRKVNFIRRFVLEFTDKNKDILRTMKDKNPFRWSIEGKLVFKEVKWVISHAPILVFLDFKKYFIMYSYASTHTVSVILM